MEDEPGRGRVRTRTAAPGLGKQPGPNPNSNPIPRDAPGSAHSPPSEDFLHVAPHELTALGRGLIPC